MTARTFVTLLLASLVTFVTSGCGAGASGRSSTGRTAVHHGSALKRATAGEPADEGPAAALEFVEYRVQPELGQISIFTGTLYGPHTVARARQSADALTRKGVLISAGDGPRMLHRTDTLNGRKFETLILAAPPDPEEPEAGWTRRLLMTVDGTLKIDCSLGDAGGEANLFVYGVQLFPADATLSVSASDNEGHELTVPEEVTSLDEQTPLTDDAFEEPAEDEPESELPAPVKV